LRVQQTILHLLIEPPQLEARCRSRKAADAVNAALKIAN